MEGNIDLSNAELLAACGIYCGVCPQYLQNPKKCGGCYSKKGFSKAERRICGVLKCVKKQKINRCNECSIFPDCERLQHFAQWDSFVSHEPVIKNLEFVKAHGEDEFLKDLKKQITDGTYPPEPIKGGITLKNIWKMAKPPFKPKKGNNV